MGSMRLIWPYDLSNFSRHNSIPLRILVSSNWAAEGLRVELTVRHILMKSLRSSEYPEAISG